MSGSGAASRRERIAGSAVATGKGDDGTTGLLYGGRISKDDARAEAYGTIDEAVACRGLARAEPGSLRLYTVDIITSSLEKVDWEALAQAHAE